MAWLAFSGPSPADIIRDILAKEAAARVSVPQAARDPAPFAPAPGEMGSDADVVRAILARERAAAAESSGPPAGVHCGEPGCTTGEDVTPVMAAVDEPDGADGEVGGVAGMPEAASGDDTDAEDWAFGIDDSEAHKLDEEARRRREQIIARCRARDVLAAATTMLARPIHGRGHDADFTFAQRPSPLPKVIGERGRRLLGYGGRGTQTDGAVESAIELASSWSHPGSFRAVHGDISTESGSRAAESLRRRLAAFEPEGIVQRLRYFRRYSNWLTAQGGAAAVSTEDETRRFFAELSSPIPSLGRSIWNSMSWVNRLLHARVAMPPDARPAAAAAAGSAEDKQAAPAPPELVRRIDWLLREAVNTDTDAKFLLSGVMLMVLSWMRFRHVQRAIPTALSRQILWVFVSKAKRPDASGVRRGFRVGVPRFTPNGTDIGQLIWGSWNRHAERSGHPAPGLILDTAGNPISLRSFNVGIQRILVNEKLTDTPLLVTSYSWRRGTDAMGEARGIPPHELAAMGAWKPAAGAGTASNPSIPLLYAGDRLAGAAASRIVHVRVMRTVFIRCPAQSPVTWEIFRKEVADIDQDCVRREVAEALVSDNIDAEIKQDAIPGIGPLKRIELTANPEKMQEHGEGKKRKKNEKKQQSSPSVISGPIFSRAWVIPRSANAKFHISTLGTASSQSPIWLCCQGKSKFQDADYRGDNLEEGITASILMKRKVCDSCLSYLDDVTVAWVRKRIQ